MRKSLRRWIGTHKSKTSSFGAFAKIEEMEKRVLLSGSPMAPNWYGEFATPEGTQIDFSADGTGEGHYFKGQLAALAPNGDVITVYPVSRTDGNLGVGVSDDNPDDIIVAAYKANGAGGLTLDTTFGDYNNDPDSSVISGPGYSIVSLDASPFSFDLSGSDSPLGIAIDPSGNINVLWQSDSSPDEGMFQLSADGQTVNGGSVIPASCITYGIVVDPVANTDGSYEAYVAGIYGTTYIGYQFASDPMVWAFNGGALDTSYGAGTGEVFQGSSPGAFTAIAASEHGIYVGDQSNDSSITIDEINSTGTLLSSVNVNVPATAPSGDVWSGYSPFGIGVAGDGDIIIGGTLGQESSYGYALIRLTSALSQTTWGPNGNGQLVVANALPTTMVVNGNGDILLNDSPDDTSITVTGTWISGSTGAQEPLFYPYIDSGTSNVSAPAATFDASGDAVLVASYSSSSNTSFETSAIYANLPDAPLLQSAASIFDQGGTPYSFNLNLDVAPGQSPSLYNLNSVSVDGRMTSQNSTENLETMQLTFAPGTELSGGTVSVANFLGGTDGTVYSTSISGNVLDIQLYNVNNMQTLVVTVNGLENANTGVSGSYQVYEGVLWGDTDSNGVVNSIDFGNFSGGYTPDDPGFGHSDNSGNFMDDFGCEGDINSIDFGILAADFGKSLPGDQLP